MSATFVASSSQMFSLSSQKTQSSSQAFNPFAPRPAGEGASFGLDGAGESNWANNDKRNGGLPGHKDDEGKLKVNYPFKIKDSNLSDGAKQRKKRGGDAERKGLEPRKHPKKLRDGAQKPRNQNGHGINGIYLAASTDEDGGSRPTSSSCVGSVAGQSEAPLHSTDPFAKKVFNQLRKDSVNPPPWPSQPGNPKNKGEMAKFRERHEEYRKKARASLTKAGLIDDPDKRKTLQDAIDFRGICEDMCPEYEKITRITEHDVPQYEKDARTTFANTSRMVKKLARSAAGQEAPLPMDVRSTATLRRTLDYLIDDILCHDSNLPALHGFLWDRTRAIRRDFTFFSSPTAEDLKTQAYILENVARFHVTSLHLLSQPGKAGEDFVEQQELEQLGKALLSLRDLYDDCNAQGITCENEAEFRAYYLIFHAHDSNTMEMLQRQWKPHFWQDSDEIRTAVSLVEALQNTNDFHGPLKPAPSLAASSVFHSFFRIVENAKVSYTMACFAECHFPHLRRSILRAVRRAMARPKELINDVTAATLNEFLKFDKIQQAIDFAKLHDIDFIPDEQAPTDCRRQFVVLSNKGPLPCPRLQHQFSQCLVEKKRGKRPLPDIIHRTIYEDPSASIPEANGFSVDAEEPLFVQDSEPEESIIPKSGETKSAAFPFSPSDQTIRGFGSKFAGQYQASTLSPNLFGTTKSQLHPTLSNPFATASTSSSNVAATNPFSSNNTPSNPFAPVSSSGSAAVTSPFEQSTLAAPPTDFQTKEPNKSQLEPANSASGKPNPFANSSLAMNGNAPSAKSPVTAAETSRKSNPITLIPLLPSVKTSSESTLSSPNTTTANTQDRMKPLASDPLAQSPSTFAQANAGGFFISPNVPLITISPTSTSLTSMSTPGPSLGFAPTEPVVLKSGPESTPQWFCFSEKSTSSPFSNFLSSKIPADARLNSPTSAFPLAAERKPDAQLIAQSQGGALASQLPSTTGVGLDASSILNLPGVVSSLAPLSSPHHDANTCSHPAKLLPAATNPPRDLLREFTSWFVQGDNGLMHDFEVFMLENILLNVYEKFKNDEEEKRRKEQEEQDNAKAKKFRVYNLSLKYFYRWKENAREKRLRQLRWSGREQFRAFREAQRAAQLKEEQEAARQAAKQRAELAALNRPDELANILKNRQRGSRRAEDALLDSGVLSGIRNEQEAIATIVREERNPSPSPASDEGFSRSRSRSIISPEGGAKTRALRERLLGGKPGRFRRSLPFMSGENTTPERPHRGSKVSERWRLKAMGIVQMPDGTAVPEYMVDEIRQGLKNDLGLESTSTRRASAAGTTQTDSRQSSRSTKREASIAVVDGTSITNKRKRPPTEGDGEVAKSGIPETASHKRVLSDAESLIKELRAMREEMEESTTWFKSQNRRLQSDVLSRGGTPLDENSI